MEVVCALCGKRFNINKSLVKERNFCCREHYHQYRKDLYIKEHTITCDNCGRLFVYTGGISHYSRSKKHYCSNKCLTESNRIYPEL